MQGVCTEIGKDVPSPTNESGILDVKGGLFYMTREQFRDFFQVELEISGRLTSVMPQRVFRFAHPDIVIGLTILGYRYEQLRLTDIDEARWLRLDGHHQPGHGTTAERCEERAGAAPGGVSASVWWTSEDRPSAVLYRNWVLDAGGFLCAPWMPEVAESSLVERSGSVGSGGGEAQERRPKRGTWPLERSSWAQRLISAGVLPLALVQRSNDQQMKAPFSCSSRYESLQGYLQVAEVIHRGDPMVLGAAGLPQVHEVTRKSLPFSSSARFQNKKLSASGQELGAEMLFARWKPRGIWTCSPATTYSNQYNAVFTILIRYGYS